MKSEERVGCNKTKKWKNIPDTGNNMYIRVNPEGKNDTFESLKGDLCG